MSARLKRSGIVALVAAAALCAGCDNSQNRADKQVRAEVAEARFLNRTEDTPAGAQTLLTTASENSEASSMVRAQAMAARAEVELQVANGVIGRIEARELELSRVLWGIMELAQQIRSSNTARAGYQKFDPKPIKDAIQGKIAAAQGGPDKPAWFAHDSSSVPTLATVTEQITKLDAELSQKKTDFENRTSQRTQLIEQAEQAAVQANSLKGQEGLTAYTNASNLRKQAGDVAVEIDGLRNQITRLERELAVARGQEAVVKEVIAQLEAQSTEVDKAWTTYEAQAAAHQELTARILGTPVTGEVPAGAVGGTIAQKAAELDRLVKELLQLRSEAVAAANSASDFFGKAYDLAVAAQVELNTRASNNPERPEAVVWREMAQVMNPLQYRLRQAAAQRVLGDLYASEAASLRGRIEVRDTVRTALEGTGLSLPAPLSNAELNSLRQTALTNADAAFKSSEEMLQTLVEGGGSEELKAVAHLNRALSSYGWAQVARQAGNETVAQNRIRDAMAARDSAFHNNIPLPPMPAELGPPPKPVAPPSDTPSADPSDPVADEAAARATVEKFLAAMEAADVEGAKAVVFIEPGGEAMFDTVMSMMTNFTKFQKAVEQKFGAQATSQPGMPNPIDELRKSKITITGDEAVLVSEGAAAPAGPAGAVETGKKLVRKDGQWKVLVNAPKDDEERQALEIFSKLGTSIGEIAAGIESGKYQTQDEVGAAFMQAFLSGLIPPGAAPGAVPTAPMPISPDPGSAPVPTPSPPPAQPIDAPPVDDPIDTPVDAPQP